MITFSTQINELMPDTFVKVYMDNGRAKYGFLVDSVTTNEEICLVSNCSSDYAVPMKFETLNRSSIVSIDPYMR